MKSSKSISRIFFLAKFHFLQFQNWQKINFCTGKKFKTTKNAISRKKNYLFDFTSFFGLDFFLIFWPTVGQFHYIHIYTRFIFLALHFQNIQYIVTRQLFYPRLNDVIISSKNTHFLLFIITTFLNIKIKCSSLRLHTLHKYTQLSFIV